MIQTIGETLQMTFGAPFDASAYDLFLKAKRLPESHLSYDYESDKYTIETHSRYANLLGVDLPAAAANEIPMPDFLFEHQREITKLALKAKRFALWADCGLGKTNCELEFARQVHTITGGRSLIITLPEVALQTIDECQKFYGRDLPILFLETKADLRRWCERGDNFYKQLAITNYEKMNPENGEQVISEMKNLSALIVDENRLKSGGGQQEWTIKRHAREAFFEWMCAWSIYVRDPRAYGWSFDVALPPEPEIIKHEIPITEAQAAAARVYNTTQTGQLALFASAPQGVVGRSKLSQIAKGFVYDGKGKDRRALPIESRKPEFVRNLIKQELGLGLQALVWTVFDEETEIISNSLESNLKDCVLTGKTPKEHRLELLNKFRCGELPLLISNSKLLGYGMNLQMCGSMIFSGWDDSFENWYQTIRRAVRFGNHKRVRIHIPFIPELELEVLENLFQKEAKFIHGIEEQEKAYLKAMWRMKLL